MSHLLILIPLIPLVGFLILVLLSNQHLPHRLVTAIGVGSVTLSAIITLIVAAAFVISPPPGQAYVQILWTWIDVANFSPHITFYVDALSLVFILVITFVGALIHLYSSEFMQEENEWNYARFFSYLNLFISMMLILVMADDMLLLYLGWEGVGLCSFLLIGFWYKEAKNAQAARKAFIVTRVGDTALLISLFLLFDRLGTLNIQGLMARAAAQWPLGSTMAVAASLLLLGGAVAKSAQLPLQVWLPDAMAGPTPVSALIHAATMVTAGVYLIARTHVLFALAPSVMELVAILGALTLLLAGFSALTQWDIKRVLAYSTMSQIGYMFLALGVGAWTAAIFHFMIHAFFKALLFLGAGVIIARLNDEHSMFKMGGLRKELPLTFWTFLIAASSLAALPLVTAGFYSKDKILYDVWSSSQGGPWLWAAGLVGALLTGIYTFRMVFLTFFGKPHALVQERSPLPQPGLRIEIPLVVLALLSVVGGFLDIPKSLGNFPLFSDFLHQVLPPLTTHAAGLSEGGLQLISAIAALGGVGIAYLFILRWRPALQRLTSSPVGAALYHFWFIGWGFDWLYTKLFVRPFLWLTHIDRNDVIDWLPTSLGRLNLSGSSLLKRTQTGQLSWYAFSIAAGAVLALAMVILLWH